MNFIIIVNVIYVPKQKWKYNQMTKKKKKERQRFNRKLSVVFVCLLLLPSGPARALVTRLVRGHVIMNC